MKRTLRATDIVVMRQSLGMAPSLPPEQVRWLLDEAERLVLDRARLEEIERQLVGPWRDVRAALNEMHGLVDRRPAT